MAYAEGNADATSTTRGDARVLLVKRLHFLLPSLRCVAANMGVVRMLVSLLVDLVLVKFANDRQHHRLFGGVVVVTGPSKGGRWLQFTIGSGLENSWQQLYYNVWRTVCSYVTGKETKGPQLPCYMKFVSDVVDMLDELVLGEGGDAESAGDGNDGARRFHAASWLRGLLAESGPGGDWSLACVTKVVQDQVGSLMRPAALRHMKAIPHHTARVLTKWLDGKWLDRPRDAKRVVLSYVNDGDGCIDEDELRNLFEDEWRDACIDHIAVHRGFVRQARFILFVQAWFHGEGPGEAPPLDRIATAVATAYNDIFGATYGELWDASHYDTLDDGDKMAYKEGVLDRLAGYGDEHLRDFPAFPKAPDDGVL